MLRDLEAATRLSWMNRPLPNKRLKLAGPAFKGSARLYTNELVPQGGALAPAGSRPAA